MQEVRLPRLEECIAMPLFCRAVGRHRRNRPTVLRRRVPLVRDHLLSVEDKLVAAEYGRDRWSALEIGLVAAI